MANIQDYFPEIIGNYLNTIKEIDNAVEDLFDMITREVILVAIGTAIGNENVIKMHCLKALKHGASKEALRAKASNIAINSNFLFFIFSLIQQVSSIFNCTGIF